MHARAIPTLGADNVSLYELLKDPTIESGDDNDREDLDVTYELRFFEDEPKNNTNDSG
jgi:hypothetical protein